MPVPEAIEAMRNALAAIDPGVVAATGRRAVQAGVQPTFTVYRDGMTAYFIGRVYHIVAEINMPATLPQASEEQITAVHNYCDRFLDWLDGAGRFGGMVVFWETGVRVDFQSDDGVGAVISIPICERYPDG